MALWIVAGLVLWFAVWYAEGYIMRSAVDMPPGYCLPDFNVWLYTVSREYNFTLFIVKLPSYSWERSLMRDKWCWHRLYLVRRNRENCVTWETHLQEEHK